jgi:predicted RNA-binding Zn-ribbon protein involved in translation (DUF1610 family)
MTLAISIPLIFIFAVGLILLIGVLVVVGIWLSKRKRHAKSPFKCTKCGYDLRGVTQPGVVTCPECGTIYE